MARFKVGDRVRHRLSDGASPIKGTIAKVEQPRDNFLVARGHQSYLVRWFDSDDVCRSYERILVPISPLERIAEAVDDV